MLPLESTNSILKSTSWFFFCTFTGTKALNSFGEKPSETVEKIETSAIVQVPDVTNIVNVALSKSISGSNIISPQLLSIKSLLVLTDPIYFPWLFDLCINSSESI